MTPTKRRRSSRKSSQLEQLTAEVAILRREMCLLSMQGKLDELTIRVARIESNQR